MNNILQHGKPFFFSLIMYYLMYN